MEMLWLVLHIFHQTPLFPWDCLTQHPYLLLKFGQLLKPWSKLKILLHPNTLFLQTHFRVSKLYIIWSWNIPWLGWWYESVFLNIAKKDIVFCWVPSHTGIKGNEKADSAANSALDLPRAKVGVPYTDFKHLISQHIFSNWQASPGRLAVLLQAVQEGWSCPHRSYTFDPFIYPPHLCEHSQFATFWWSAIILLENGKICLVEEMWWNHLDSTPH